MARSDSPPHEFLESLDSPLIGVRVESKFQYLQEVCLDEREFLFRR